LPPRDTAPRGVGFWNGTLVLRHSQMIHRRLKALREADMPNQSGCLLSAQSGHSDALNQCALSGVKQTSVERYKISAYDPKRHSVLRIVATQNDGLSSFRQM
jgi:hypothetical protein